MTTYPNTTATVNASINSAMLFPGAPGLKAQTAQTGGFSISTTLRYYSLLAYAVPSERVRRLLPPSFGGQVEETAIDGRRMAWLSVASFLDGLNDRTQFEQTSYRLHVVRNGEPAGWLLGISLGSLSAVARRNLWSMPWHLSAMEFQASGDQHRLQTQGEWANAQWQVEDTTEALHLECARALPRSLQQTTTTDYFLRRDGGLGAQRIRLLNPAFTSGALMSARCDLLARLGLLTQGELARPQLIAMQQALHCQLGAPSTLSNIASGQLRRAA